MRYAILGLLILLSACIHADAPALGSLDQSAANAPYETLREAYRRNDAVLAGAAYSENARLIYRNPGGIDTTFIGRPSVAQSFAEFFGEAAGPDGLDLNFRITARESHGGRIRDAGFYRLRYPGGESFGRFETELVRRGDDYLFASDIGDAATRADFEDAAAPLLFDSEAENLDRIYYRGLTGRYAGADGCEHIVTMSVARLMVRNGCTLQWRGLYRQSGMHWRGGDTVLTGAAGEDYRFVALK